MQLTKLVTVLGLTTLGAAVPALHPRQCNGKIASIACYSAFATARGKCEDAEATVAGLAACVPAGLVGGVSFAINSPSQSNLIVGCTSNTVLTYP